MNSEQITAFLQEHWSWVTPVSYTHLEGKAGHQFGSILGAIRFQ